MHNEKTDNLQKNEPLDKSLSVADHCLILLKTIHATLPCSQGNNLLFIKEKSHQYKNYLVYYYLPFQLNQQKLHKIFLLIYDKYDSIILH